MNGGMPLQLSIVNGMSARGNDTLTMCPVTCGVPPVAVATALGSMAGPRAPASPPSEFEASSVAESEPGAEESAESVQGVCMSFELLHDATTAVYAVTQSHMKTCRFMSTSSVGSSPRAPVH